MRLRLHLAYDGSGFSGWAKQPGRRTVQGVLEDALTRQPPGAAVLLPTVVAGRTDAGVHATGQVSHVDVTPFAGERRSTRVPLDDSGIADLDRMCHRWNRYLPDDVRVVGAQVAPAGFDARFSAVRRYYRYQVSDAPWGVDPLLRHDTLAWGRQVDVERMNSASAALLGLNDFAAFCKQREGGTTIRDLQGLRWERADEHLVRASVWADAFCHSMVRSLVGALLLVGDGRRAVEWPADLLRGGVRDSAVAPARGLTLTGVDYPQDGELAARAEQTRNIRA